jgi:hypothetical protein
MLPPTSFQIWNSKSHLIWLHNHRSWFDILIIISVPKKNADTAFNNFLNNYLRIFYSSFPIKKVYFKSENKAWLTPGLKISCANKRRHFLAQRSSNDPILINYYKRYCKILSRVIKSAKQRYYNSILTRSKNKARTTWNIVKKQF